MFRIILSACMCAGVVKAAEYHVARNGDDANPGTVGKPFATISKGAEVAQPGDVITVYEGVYREEINPPRGGTSDEKRIVYRAAEGEKVVIKGSEVAKGWTYVEGDIWKLVIKEPESFFGDFNPFRTQIYGDWYLHRGRLNHLGQVYLNGKPLTEAASLKDVLESGDKPFWYTNDNSIPKDHIKRWVSLLDVRGNGDGAVAAMAADFSDKQGAEIKTHEEKKYLHWAVAGNWLTLKDVDLGKGTTQIMLNGLTSTMGLYVEIRLDDPEGKLLGTCPVDFTGTFWEMNWKEFGVDIEPISGKQTLCLVFREMPEPEPNAEEVIIWAQFKDVNPNEELVEINVRETIFYPRKTGIDYITVSGFTLEQGSPNWAPPTAEQRALIGTHWSKGWIIENNIIRHSPCVGLTLGKYGDEYDNTSADSAEGYVETIRRAETKGWTKDTVGSHIVRNNTIYDCGAAGICGSLGAIFSEITGNHVYDINIGKPWGGHEMAGIKFHAPIDMLIKDNRIHHTSRGIWLDWMTQGTRVTGNLFHDNYGEDIYIEVNHGPYVVDNNLFMSETAWFSVKDWSQGGAFINNLFLKPFSAKSSGRATPYHKPHTTEIAGITNIQGGDNRFYNNIFATTNGLTTYANAKVPIAVGDNQFMAGTTLPKLVGEGEEVYLELTLPEALRDETGIITTEDLGQTVVSQLPYKNYDETDLIVNNDYWGVERKTKSPVVGPIQTLETERVKLKVWPKGE